MTPLGFRAVGSVSARRRLVDHRRAFVAACELDPRYEPDRESYLSHFVFGPELAAHFERTASEAGFIGPCSAGWIFFDLDRADDLSAALRDARLLAGFILDRFRTLDDDGVLAFFSGGKGAHIGIPSTLWDATPSVDYAATAGRFLQGLADAAGVVIDRSVYSKTRLFRAPNSRHAKTGLYKRRLTFDELMHLKLAAILDRAREPAAFDPPRPAAADPIAVADWRAAGQAAERRAADRKASYPTGRLTATTRRFIREGAVDGERALMVFKAAANLAESGAPLDLARDLLTEAGLDSGLPPREVERQITTGHTHGSKQREGESQ